MNLLKIFILVFVVIMLTGCQAKREYTAKPTKSILNPENDLLEVNTVAYHLNDSITRIYIEVRNENLQYRYNDTSISPYAEIKIHYELMDQVKQKQILDSGTIHLKDRSEKETLVSKSIYSQFDLQAMFGARYRLNMEVFDLNKKIEYKKQMDIDKSNHLNAQNFVVSVNERIAFKTNFKKADRLTIRVNSPLVFTAYVDAFSKDFSLALPPFSIKEPRDMDLIPDSSFQMPLNSDFISLSMPERGFYHIGLDPKHTEGLNLFTFDASFPRVSSTEEMINSTRYIMTKDEFNNCKEAENKKKAIDHFWLEIGGSDTRAKELLKQYYNRVKEANKYFSSYCEGWKSDRGMIFIVFGQASSVVQKEDEVIWIYSTAVNQSTLTFIFKKVDSPYSDNIYVLDRSQLYKPAWSNAVDQWRQGIYYEGRR